MKTGYKNKNFRRLRVPAGLLGVILILILAQPTSLSIIIGAAVSLFGFLLRAWAGGHIEKKKKLAVSGPYRFTRHPLYLGNLILGISLSVSANSWWSTLVFLFYFILFYPIAIIQETKGLRRLFPEEQRKYEQKVSSFFPGLKGIKTSSSQKFNPKFYLKNKEYRVIFGGFAIWTVLLLKCFLFPGN